MRISDLSSDVCASDLLQPQELRRIRERAPRLAAQTAAPHPRRTRPGAALDDAARPQIGGGEGRLFPARNVRALVGAGVRGGNAERVRTAIRPPADCRHIGADRSEEHTSELQSLMRISYAVF